MDFKVEDLQIGKPGATGNKVENIYARRAPRYAVYATAERLVVQYADDDALQEKQRVDMAQVSALRNDIGSLLAGWRTSSDPDLNSNAKYYDYRLAEGLAAVLDGNLAGGQAALQATKDDIIAERTSWARFIYLIVASITCTLLIALIVLITLPWVRGHVFKFPDEEDYRLWLGVASGSVGAFFSVAIAIRTRTILTDLRTRDNSADAVLRIVIGAVAGAVLVDLVLVKALAFAFNGATFDAQTAITIMLLGFAAGFSERLVPDLLKKMEDANSSGGKPAGGAASGGTPAATTPAPVAAAPADDAADQGADACEALHAGAAVQATADEDLPAATGGVAASTP
jgi:hypothetical protein